MRVKKELCEAITTALSNNMRHRAEWLRSFTTGRQSLRAFVLKLRDWDDEINRNRTKWRVEVSNFRRAIKDILEDSLSLNNYLKDNHSYWYTKTINNYVKNKLFSVKDTAVIPLPRMMDDDDFGD